MYWADSVVSNLTGDQLVSTGISPSGPIHVGNMREIITGDILYKASLDRGLKSRFIYLCDDLDPLRKVYPFLDSSYAKYVGVPLSYIPSPDGNGKYSDYFLKPFLETLQKINVNVEVISTTGLYKTGKLADAIDTAIKNRETIRKIMHEIAGYDLDESWYPYEPRCSKCGKINSSHVISYEYPYVHYKCEYCGNEGTSDIRTDDGKMPWRVEWPAKWYSLGVTIEPFGKDHAAAGGSYDTGKEIARQVFHINPPVPLMYERILLKGVGVMHSSTGISIPASEVVKFAPPEILRFLIAKNDPSRHIDFDPGLGLLNLIDDYEKIENAYFGLEKPNNENYKRIYEMSRIKILNAPEKINFRHIVNLIQIYKDDTSLLEALRRSGYNKEYIDHALRDEIETAKYWLDKYAPDNIKFSLSTKHIDLSEKEKTILSEFLNSVSGIEWTSENIHNVIYDIIGRNKIPPKDGFSLFYRVFIDRERGPRLGYFLANLDRNYVISRIKDLL
ncbi:lysine--tRNA ligase [Acidiplasma sp.]|uniref:lysine--tRNA ligase n=1 Tax=Acidiplasma sp. TaxID=1872114 RepID=UPI003167449C